MTSLTFRHVSHAVYEFCFASYELPFSAVENTLIGHAALLCGLCTFCVLCGPAEPVAMCSAANHTGNWSALCS